MKNKRSFKVENSSCFFEEKEVSLNEIQQHAQLLDKYVITSSTDLTGRITGVSQAFCDISGYCREELLGKNHNVVRHSDMPKSLYEELWSTIRSGQVWHGEVKNLKKNGEHYWVKVHIELSLNDLGEIKGYVAIREDITDKKYIEEVSITDELTQCYNRRFYNQILSKEIALAKRDSQWLVFLMLDADHFKKYNDTYGHQEGDQVLIAIANVLKSSFRRAGDYVFRLGGEEFAVLYRVKEKEQGLMMAESTIQAMLEKNIAHSGNIPYYKVTLSAGLVLLDPAIDYIEDEIYKYADVALYQAKNNGRHRVVLHDNEVELF